MTFESPRSHRRRFSFGVFAAVWLTLASPAFAQEPSPTELAIARRLFKEATELESEGEWKLAASKLREAILIKDTPGLRFHLAHCEERMGQLVEAMLNYDRARDLIAAGAKAPDVEALLEPARRSLEQRLPSLLIVIPAGVADLSVQLNGRVQARSILGRPAPVNPGNYRIVVSAPGHDDFVEDVALQQGDKKRIDAKLTPSKAPAAQPAAVAPPPQARPVRSSPPDEMDTRTYVVIAESAATLAALGVGVGFLFVKNGARDRIRRAQSSIDERSAATGDRCDSNTTDDALLASCADLDDAISDHDNARNWSTGGFIVAGVGAASVALTIALWPDADESPRISAIVTPGGPMFALRGSF